MNPLTTFPAIVFLRRWIWCEDQGEEMIRVMPPWRGVMEVKLLYLGKGDVLGGTTHALMRLERRIAGKVFDSLIYISQNVSAVLLTVELQTPTQKLQQIAGVCCDSS
ncbi:hypothetical protein CBR_g57350 [Chara braunii]|uniref:Uncharacterized protein n=1 Tax=Chara braunii TaxID=69332 RepID=A0A388ME41_CHABU|nr:hypothetical protein CBR_g57350 [Chara braunii]|eukprot:GBG92830.1 hypothetical protein CBR_g57350 [Chara braunii]